MENELDKDLMNNGTQNEKVCDLLYLSETMGGKKNLIKEILEEFLIQLPEELSLINEAVLKEDFIRIKSVAHTMKSTLSIMGITQLVPVLNELEELGASQTEMGKIRTLLDTLNSICKLAMEELNKAKHMYQ